MSSNVPTSSPTRPEVAILLHSPALNALKRPQLVALAKQFGLKGAGKNVELIERLQQHGQELRRKGDQHEEGVQPAESVKRSEEGETSWLVMEEPSCSNSLLQEQQDDVEMNESPLANTGGIDQFGVQSRNAYNESSLPSSTSNSSLASTIRSVGGSFLRKFKSSTSLPSSSSTSSLSTIAPSTPKTTTTTTAFHPTVVTTPTATPTSNLYPSLSPTSIASFSPRNQTIPQLREPEEGQSFSTTGTTTTTETSSSPGSIQTNRPAIRLVSRPTLEHFDPNLQNEDQDDDDISMISSFSFATRTGTNWMIPQGTTHLTTLSNAPLPSPSATISYPTLTPSRLKSNPFIFGSPMPRNPSEVQQSTFTFSTPFKPLSLTKVVDLPQTTAAKGSPKSLGTFTSCSKFDVPKRTATLMSTSSGDVPEIKSEAIEGSNSLMRSQRSFLSPIGAETPYSITTTTTNRNELTNVATMKTTTDLIMEEMNKRAMASLQSSQELSTLLSTSHGYPGSTRNSSTTTGNNKRMFEKSHEEGFKRMKGIDQHYAAKRPRPIERPELTNSVNLNPNSNQVSKSISSRTLSNMARFVPGGGKGGMKSNEEEETVVVMDDDDEPMTNRKKMKLNGGDVVRSQSSKSSTTLGNYLGTKAKNSLFSSLSSSSRNQSRTPYSFNGQNSTSSRRELGTSQSTMTRSKPPPSPEKVATALREQGWLGDGSSSSGRQYAHVFRSNISSSSLRIGSSNRVMIDRNGKSEEEEKKEEIRRRLALLKHQRRKSQAQVNAAGLRRKRTSLGPTPKFKPSTSTLTKSFLKSTFSSKTSSTKTSATTTNLSTSSRPIPVPVVHSTLTHVANKNNNYAAASFSRSKSYSNELGGATSSKNGATTSASATTTTTTARPKFDLQASLKNHKPIGYTPKLGPMQSTINARVNAKTRPTSISFSASSTTMSNNNFSAPTLASASKHHQPQLSVASPSTAGPKPLGRSDKVNLTSQSPNVVKRSNLKS